MSNTMTDKLAGCYRGIVLDSNDPQGLHRVRVQVPDLLGLSDLGWAWPAIPNLAGQTPPNEQDPVWVMFEAGDIERPVYIGTWIATRPGGGSLQDNYVLSGGSNVYPSTASEFLGVQVNGDTFDRYTATAGGMQYWGPGNAPADVSLGRLSASTLGLTGNLSVSGSLSASSLSLSMPLSISSGGTGSATQNFIDLTTAQNITGVKTFTTAPVVPANSFPESAITNLVADLAALGAAGGTVVHLAGTETITGAKTFTVAPVVPANSFPETAVTNLVADLATKAIDTTVVHIAGAETVTGSKTFSTAPAFSTPLGIASGGTGSSVQNFVTLDGNGATVNNPGNQWGYYATGAADAIGLRLNSTGTGGRQYGIYSTAAGSGWGQGLLAIYDHTATQLRMTLSSANNGYWSWYGDDHLFGRGVFGANAGRVHLGDLGTTDAYVQAENGSGAAAALWLRAGNGIYFGSTASTPYGSFDTGGNMTLQYDLDVFGSIMLQGTSSRIRGPIQSNGVYTVPNTTTYTITSTTFIDHPQNPSSGVPNFDKRSNSSCLIVSITSSGWFSSGAQWVEFGVQINGVDYIISHFFFNQAGVHTQITGERRVASGLGAGVYYIVPRIRVQSGTFNQDANDMFTMTIWESE